MLTVAFGKSTMSKIQVQLWYNRFKEGREGSIKCQGFAYYFKVIHRLREVIRQKRAELWKN